MDSLLQDLRHALRALRASPGFTLVALLTLGLGIGANAAIFSVIDATMLRPLPYEDPGTLVAINHSYPELGLEASVSLAGFRDYSEQTRIFAHTAGENFWLPNLTGDGDPERLVAVKVLGDYFATYGVSPAMGRALRPEEAAMGSDHVVVVSDGFWRRKLGADPAAVGKTVQLDGETYRVVGVMPASFRDFFNRTIEMWAPGFFAPAAYDARLYTNEFLNVAARLRPGETPAQAQADMKAFAEQLKTRYPGQFSKGWTLHVLPLVTLATQNVRTALWVLMAAVGFVLLIACANVANLQLARASARSRELAVRVALGASPRRLMRYMLVEAVCVALAGGALGILLDVWGVPALLALNSGALPPDVGVNGHVLAFTLVVALLTGLLFGVLPAWRFARADVHGTLKEGGRGNTGDRAGLTLRRGLVVSTIAMALALLVGAGLLMRSFARMVGVDPGFAPDHLLTFNVALPQASYPNDTVKAAVYQRIQSAIAAVPGVRAVGGATSLPFTPFGGTASFNVEGFTPGPSAPMPWGDIGRTTPGYFTAMGNRILKGRDFTMEDGPGGPPVAIVDEDLVNRYWKGQDPIGKRITFNNLSDTNITWITVVGVVRHMMQSGLDGTRHVQYYFPVQRRPQPFLSYAVRTEGDPLAMLGSVRAAVHSVDPNLPLANADAMDNLLDASTGPRRFSMVLLGGFAVLALALACIGLYGVMSFTVNQRFQELGVRVALGARAWDVLRLILGEGMRLALFGSGIGLAAAFVVTRLMRSMLFDTAATDPVTFVLIPLVLLAVALLASWLPARRAASVDPMMALRNE